MKQGYPDIPPVVNTLTEYIAALLSKPCRTTTSQQISHGCQSGGLALQVYQADVLKDFNKGPGVTFEVVKKLLCELWSD